MARPDRYNHANPHGHDPLSLLMRVALWSIARGTRREDQVEFIRHGLTTIVAPFTSTRGGATLVQVKITNSTLTALRSRGYIRIYLHFEPPDVPRELFQWYATRTGLKLAEKTVIDYPIDPRHREVPWNQLRWPTKQH